MISPFREKEKASKILNTRCQHSTIPRLATKFAGSLTVSLQRTGHESASYGKIGWVNWEIRRVRVFFTVSLCLGLTPHPPSGSFVSGLLVPLRDSDFGATWTNWAVAFGVQARWFPGLCHHRLLIVAQALVHITPEGDIRSHSIP